jgi:hypothetical protein
VFRSNFILGFPGETEHDVDVLEAFLEEHRLDWVGLFPFSREDGTPSELLPDQVPEEVAAARVARIAATQELLADEAARRFVGRELAVTVEATAGPGADEWTVGRSYREAPDTDGEVVLVAAGTGGVDGLPADLPVGRTVTARVVATAGVDLVAEAPTGGAGPVAVPAGATVADGSRPAPGGRATRGDPPRRPPGRGGGAAPRPHWFNVPNLLTFLRALLVPVILWLLTLDARRRPVVGVRDLRVRRGDRLDRRVGRAALARRHPLGAAGRPDRRQAADRRVAGVPRARRRAAVVGGRRDRRAGGRRHRAAVRLVSRLDLVMPASNWGKAKTVSQILAVGAYLLPLELGILPELLLGLAVVLTVWSGIEYAFRAGRLARAEVGAQEANGR